MLCQPSMAFHEITTRRDSANSRPNTLHLYYVCEKRLEHKVADDFSGGARHQILQVYQVGNHFCIVTYNTPTSNHEHEISI